MAILLIEKRKKKKGKRKIESKKNENRDVSIMEYKLMA